MSARAPGGRAPDHAGETQEALWADILKGPPAQEEEPPAKEEEPPAKEEPPIGSSFTTFWTWFGPAIIPAAAPAARPAGIPPNSAGAKVDRTEEETIDSSSSCDGNIA